MPFLEKNTAQVEGKYVSNYFGRIINISSYGHDLVNDFRVYFMC